MNNKNNNPLELKVAELAKQVKKLEQMVMLLQRQLQSVALDGKKTKSKVISVQESARVLDNKLRRG